MGDQGPETIASIGLLPSINGQGAIAPFARRMRRQAWSRRSRSVRALLRRQIAGAADHHERKGGVSRTATMSAR